jgi:hypothetical protein
MRWPLLSVRNAILAALGAAAATGLVVSNAAALAFTSKDDDDGPNPLLLYPRGASFVFAGHRSHRSHSSHSSHSSHYSGSGTRSGGGYGYGTPEPVAPPEPPPRPPPPPRPGRVSVAAYPGGRIFVDGRLVGTDVSGVLTLAPGSHDVRVENRFLGTNVSTIFVGDGETGVIDVSW